MQKAQEFLNEISDELASIDNKEDQLKQLLDYGNEIKPLEIDLKIEDNLVKGCSSVTYLVGNTAKEGNITFLGDSDSLFAKSYIYILTNAFNGYTSEDILKESKPLVDEFIKNSSSDLSLIESRTNSFGSIYAAMIRICANNLVN